MAPLFCLRERAGVREWPVPTLSLRANQVNFLRQFGGAVGVNGVGLLLAWRE